MIPRQDFIQALGFENRTLVKNTYNSCKNVASLLNCPLEKVFGTVHYANILMQYHHLTAEESRKKAASMYELSF